MYETHDRIISDDPLTTELPIDLQTTLGDFLGTDSVETLAAWITEVRTHTDAGPISMDELCHADEETPHWGELDGERYHFICFYDAVILAALADDPVDIHTESPSGERIEATAVGTDALTVEPESAVFSFGYSTTAAPDEPSIETMYSAGCPYVKAFPDAAAYEQWAGTVDADTVALPLSGATDIAAALVE
ncbi:alkylmercury lyase [Halonotius terrestris]|uniref:Alkylmercury lyase n=1 Tax=Halonotius terrestris TaxID=2487750 RepID=A0A8J8PAL5_9EURY|nr:organomercurial lyase [Halonotius terrestris]TQQ79801.1 alkylmercury lyase [Halonotius terrestris]